MSELDKNKAGLHKQVSSVFKGVPVPQNNGTRQPADTPSPNPAPDVTPKPASVNKQNSPSSLITRLSQSEDSPSEAKQSQTANVSKKPTATSQIPKSPPAKKLSQPKEPSRQFVPQPGDSLLIEEAGEGLLQQIKDKLFTPKPGSSPAKQKVMVIMIPILAIIMIFMFRQVLSKSPRKSKGAGTDNDPVPVAKADTGNQIDWKIPEPIKIVTKEPEKLPDETDNQNQEKNETNGKVETATENIIVRGIVFSEDKPSAIIGSEILHVGDVINNATIVEIEENSIEFEKNGYRWKQKVDDEKKIPVVENTDETESQSESINKLKSTLQKS
jgi:hypothetical protein